MSTLEPESRENHCIVVTPPSGLEPHLIAACAGLLHVTAYEARTLLLGGPFPRPVVSGLARADARQLVQALARHGLPAMSLDKAELEAYLDEAITVRSLEFDPDRITCIRDGGTSGRLTRDEVIGLFRGRRSTVYATALRSEKTREFGPGRAMHPSSPQVATHRTVELSLDDEFVVINVRQGRPCVLLASRLLYDCLGDDRRPLARENFERVVNRISGIFPEAPLDETLLSSKTVPGLRILRLEEPLDVCLFACLVQRDWGAATVETDRIASSTVTCRKH